jgi:hypothetical protein
VISGIVLLAMGLLLAADMFMAPGNGSRTRMMPWPISLMMLVIGLVVGTGMLTWAVAHHWPLG